MIEDGSFYLVQTQLPAGLFLRVTLINPLTNEGDLEDLLKAVGEAGLKEMSAGSSSYPL